MNFEKVYEDFKIYAMKRHKKQGFITLQTDFNNQVLPYFKNRNIEDITRLDIINWQNIILSLNYSNRYNAKIYYSFNYFMKYCINCGYIHDNFVQLVGSFPKRIEIKSHTTYNIYQFRKFRRYVNNFVIKEYFNFIYFYGARPGETMALTFNDIKGKYVRICHSIHRKGDRELDTPKNQSSVRVIKVNLLMCFRFSLLKKYYFKKYGSLSNDYFVFGGIKPLAPTTIDRIKKVAYDRANLPSITQHEFRHSYATRMIHKKKPIDIVSRSMGHSKVSTTLDIYLHQEKNTLNVFSS